MASRRVTMQDIADALGLHQSTVSRALADHPQTAAAVKQRVRDCARRLGYRQDPRLRALAAARWQQQTVRGAPIIAVVSAAPTTAIRSYLRGHQSKVVLGRAAGRLGYRLEYHELDALDDPSALGDALARRGVSGILFGPLAGYEDLSSLHWPWERFHLVAADVWYHRLPLVTLLADHAQAIGLCWERLRAAGCRRPALAVQRRGRCFEDELIATWHHLAARDGLASVPVLRFWPEERPRAIVDWFARHRPDVVVGSHAGVYWDLIDAGIDLPRAARFFGLQLGRRDRQIAGCALPVDLQVEALAHIDRSFRGDAGGLPEHPYAIRYAYRWRDGDSG